MKATYMVLGTLAALLLLSVAAASQMPDAVSLGRLDSPMGTLAASGELQYPGELDWYTFEVLEATTVQVFAEGTGGAESIRALLFDADFDFLGHAENQRIAADLAPGLYSIRIDSVENETRRYALVISNGVEVESNDGLLEATALGEIDDRVRIQGAIHPVGDADFYRFEIPAEGLASSALLLETDGPHLDDSILVLYEFSESLDRYVPIAVDDDSGDGYWSRLLVKPNPGVRYAVRIEETGIPLVGIGDYSLNVSPIELHVDVEPNDAAETATLLVMNDDSKRWETSGVLYEDDAVDVYQLSLDVGALLEIRTAAQAVEGDFDTVLTLRNPEGAILAENDDTGASLWSALSISVEPGDYYISVRAAAGGGMLLPYRLEVAQKDVRTLSEVEPNDTNVDVQPLDWRSGEVLVMEAEISEGGDIDSFALTLDVATHLLVETGPGESMMSADTVLTIYDEDFQEVAANDDFEGSWSRVEEMLPSGTYFIVVEGYFSDDAFDYTLLISSR